MSPLRDLFERWRRQQSGSAAVEFAMVMPAFICLIVGGMYATMMVSTMASLHYAVELGARCASVTSTICSDAASTASFTQAHYQGPGLVNPRFTYSASGCGHTVTGTATVALDLGISRTNVPVSASACFP
jgi:Flp pilus assembly protein TadG